MNWVTLNIVKISKFLLFSCERYLLEGQFTQELWQLDLLSFLFPPFNSCANMATTQMTETLLFIYCILNIQTPLHTWGFPTH